MNSDNDNKPRGILFLLADGSEWAHMLPCEEMTPRGVLGLDDESEEDLSPEFEAHFFPGNDRLH